MRPTTCRVNEKSNNKSVQEKVWNNQNQNHNHNHNQKIILPLALALALALPIPLPLPETATTQSSRIYTVHALVYFCHHYMV